jgi:hypothetical protein
MVLLMRHPPEGLDLDVVCGGEGKVGLDERMAIYSWKTVL